LVAPTTSILISDLEGNTNMSKKLSTPPFKRLKRRFNKLTDSTIRGAKPSKATYKLSDGGGLYCEVVELLLELKECNADSKFLFPSPRALTAPLSNVGPLAALRRMGYDKETMTIHGFRTIASTCLNELGYKSDHIERQLAHKESDKTRGAYNRARYIEQRRQLLQDWADILDRLRQEARDRRKARMDNRRRNLRE